MKKIRILITCFLLFFLIPVSDHKEALANTNKYSTNINLSNQNKQASFKFKMPNNGKIKLNIQVNEKGSIPGTLTFIIQKDFSVNSEKIKEITGITSTNGVNDLVMDLNQGEYYFRYELSNATGDFTDTALGVNCQTEILATVSNNISELSVNNIKSFAGITKKNYDKINFVDDSQRKDLILPFTVQKSGGVLISLNQTKQSSDHGKLKACVYKDQACSEAIGTRFVLNETDDTINVSRAIPEKGTYYVKFTYDYESTNGLTTFPVKLYFISGEDRTLTNNKTTAAYQTSGNDKILYKIDVKATQLLEFWLKPYNNEKKVSSDFRLLNENRKQLSKKSTVEGISFLGRGTDYIIKYYTVKRGTYYLEVSAESSLYQIESIFISVNNQSGNSKSKAKLLKVMGKSVMGFSTISDDVLKLDWYKFNVTSSKQFICKLYDFLDGEMYYELLDSKGKVLQKCNKELHKGKYSYSDQICKNLSKGTYYIRVCKGSKQSSYTYVLALYNKKGN